MRRLFALVPLALALASVWHYHQDRAARDPIVQAAERFTIELRRPIESEMIAYAPSADFAAQVLATSALGDALGSKRLTNLSPAERRAWLDVPLDLEEELSAAIDQQLVAIRRNPGWPMHRYFLGKLAYVKARRSLGGEVEPHKWLLPLESAWRNAPNHEQTIETLASVLLEAHRVLADEEREMTTEVLAAALADPQYVSLAFDVAVDIVGKDAAFSALAGDPASLSAAARSMGRRGDLAGAYALYGRWESAEWELREADLEAMRTRKARGDWSGLLGAASTWASRHDVQAFDTPEARRQAEQVLRLWPKDRVGSWGSDPRARFVRYFLDGRIQSIDPAVLDATISALSNAPAPVRARLALAAGNMARAESLVERAGSEGAFEWTDYFVDLARLAVQRNDLDSAVAAIDRISPSARRECDVLVARRLAGEDLVAPDISVTDDEGRILDEAWSANGMLGVCVDPIASAERTLVVDLEAPEGAVVEWGLNMGRRDTILVEGSARVELPLSGLTGRNVLYTKVLWGSNSVKRTARVE